MDYQKIIDTFRSQKKFRYSKFVQLYYIENKPKDYICEECFIGSNNCFYLIKSRVKREIQLLITNNPIGK